MLVAFRERPFLGESLPPNGMADHSLAEKPKVRENFRWTGLGQKT